MSLISYRSDCRRLIEPFYQIASQLSETKFAREGLMLDKLSFWKKFPRSWWSLTVCLAITFLCTMPSFPPCYVQVP